MISAPSAPQSCVIRLLILLLAATTPLPAPGASSPTAASAPAASAPAASAPAASAPAASANGGAQPSAGIDPLLPRLRDKDPRVVTQTLRILGSAGDLKAFRPILETLSRNVDGEVQSAGLAALEKLEYTPAFLIDVLGRSSELPLAREYAAYMLGQMRSTDAVMPLIQALQSPDDRLRDRAMDALGRIKDERAWKPLILAANKDPSPTLRAKAQKTVEQLASMGGDRGVDPDALAAQLKDPSVLRRRQAAQALSQYGTWWSIRPLIEALEDADPEVRRYAARALGDLQDKRAVEPLIAFLPRSSGLARQTAIIALGVLKDDSAVDPLLRYLKDPDADTRKMAARALAGLGSPKAGPALTDALSDIIPENRREAARALGKVRYAGGIAGLMGMVKDDIQDNQIEAVRAMGKLGSEAVAPLQRVLDHRDPMVALTAVLALKEIGDPAAVPALEQLARHHKDNYVREEALETSIELKGKQRLKSEKIPEEPR